MSAPWPPAFMRTAPPTDPGTPTAHSSPLSPASTVRRASTGSPAPPPADTSTGSPAGPSAAPISIPLSPGPRWTARPKKPASATKRLDPLPTTSTGTAVPARARRTASRSSTEPASNHRAAGPPTR